MQTSNTAKHELAQYYNGVCGYGSVSNIVKSHNNIADDADSNDSPSITLIL